VLFHIATGAAVFVLRRTRPELPAPLPGLGYPVVPALFIVASLILMVTPWSKSAGVALGLLFVALGLPAYAWWRRHGVPVPPPEPA